MRVLFSGSRSWKDRAKIEDVVLSLDWNYDTIIHGACPNGADAIVDETAYENDYNIEDYPANWTLYGDPAGNIRNQEMVDLAIDYAYFFWDGTSPGTKDCIERVLKAKIPHKVIAAKGKETVVQENYYRLLGVQMELCYDGKP